MPRALIRQSILPLMLLAVTACAGGPPIVTAQSAGCSSLTPPEWKRRSDMPPLPAANANVGEWVSFADALVGKIDQLEDRINSLIGIYERCEARDMTAVRQATRHRFLGLE